MNILVRVFTDGNEIIILPVKRGKVVGVDKYFGKGCQRDREDYDEEECDLPIAIQSRTEYSLE